ncbi:MAG: PH domain-containing protein [Anaerolineales bacterium]|jgi:hypothetical protein
MEFHPPRPAGLALNLIAIIVLLSAALVGLIQISTAPLSLLTVLWISLPLVGVPLSLFLLYELYGLIRAGYHVDRDGLRVRWGWAVEELPISDILSVSTVSRQESLQPLGRRLRWPATAVGSFVRESGTTLDYFIALGRDDLIAVEAKNQTLILSPDDPVGFVETYQQATMLGSLQPFERVSQRPRFAVVELLADPLGRLLLLAGILLPLFLLGYLAFRVPDLPSQVPFGFDPQGAPETFAPPGRLLLLPLIDGLCWLFNFSFGLWLYRQPAQRFLSYFLWTASIAVGILFWGATLQLLTV